MTAAGLGFGLMRLPLRESNDPKDVDMDAVDRMVDAFISSGWDYFDTGYFYHQGRSEPTAGAAIADRHPRGSFRLATKMPLRALKEKGDPERFFSEQLSRCHVDMFDSYLMHNLCRGFREATDRTDAFGFCLRMRDEGRIGRLGMSFHDDPSYLREVLDTFDGIEFVQLQINYLDWENPSVRARECYEIVREHDLPIVVMEPVKGGVLSDVPGDVEALLRSVEPDWSPASWALRFVAGLDGVETVLSGMSDMGQLEDNMSTFRDVRPLDDEHMEVLRKAAVMISSVTAVPCTGCGYCTEVCPKAIPIPDYFSIYNNHMRIPEGRPSPHPFYYMNRSHGVSKASDCIGCRRCEAVCPQHIKVRDLMPDVARKLETL